MPYQVIEIEIRSSGATAEPSHRNREGGSPVCSARSVTVRVTSWSSLARRTTTPVLSSNTSSLTDPGGVAVMTDHYRRPSTSTSVGFVIPRIDRNSFDLGPQRSFGPRTRPITIELEDR